MSSFTDFIRGKREPRRDPGSRDRAIHTTFLLEEFDGYTKVGILKGASTHGSPLTRSDTITLVLETISTELGVPKESVLGTFHVKIRLSCGTTDGEICVKRKNLPVP